MRNALVAAMIAVGLCLLAPGSASAAPPLADHTVTSKAQASSLVDEARVKRTAKRADKKVYVQRKFPKYKRRHDWTYYPYWRPYQYRYWKYIYPYGGPLF